MDKAELHRPKREAEAAPSAPSLARKPKPPGPKLLKSSAKAAKGVKPTPTNPSASGASIPAVARAAAPGLSAPGGRAAARLLGSALEAACGAAAPTFAQLQLAEEKARKKAARAAQDPDQAAEKPARQAASQQAGRPASSSSAPPRAPPEVRLLRALCMKLRQPGAPRSRGLLPLLPRWGMAHQPEGVCLSLQRFGPCNDSPFPPLTELLLASHAAPGSVPPTPILHCHGVGLAPTALPAPVPDNPLCRRRFQLGSNVAWAAPTCMACLLARGARMRKMGALV